MKEDRFGADVAKDMLVEWEGCFIRPLLLDQIRKAVMKLDDPAQQEDIRAELEERLRGKDVLSIDDLPANVRRALKLNP